MYLLSLYYKDIYDVTLIRSLFVFIGKWPLASVTEASVRSSDHIHQQQLLGNGHLMRGNICSSDFKTDAFKSSVRKNKLLSQ